MCHVDIGDLGGAAAKEYIQWGESRGYHRGRSVASRKRWYDLGERRQSTVALGYQIGTTSRTSYAPSGLYFSDNFQQIYVDDAISLRLCAVLNSALLQLMFSIAVGLTLEADF